MERPKVNKNLEALLANHVAGAARKPIVCLEGSARSGKTWSILEYLIVCCLDIPNLIVTAFRHDGTTHQGSTIRDFHAILAAKFPKTAKAIHWNAQEKTCRFPNGSVFEFRASNDISKLHGPQRDICWINEAMEVSYEAWCQISVRTSLMTICDWNPSLAHHWVFDRVLTRPDSMVVNTTYKDNPHLSAQQVAEIEKYDPGRPENVVAGTADKWLWEVYGLGKRGRREGVIYTAWMVEDQWPDRMACQRWGYGVDWGFAQDPCAVIECALFHGDLWLREAVYETGLVIRPSDSVPGMPSLVGRLKQAQVDPAARMHCDGARPDCVADLRIGGYSFAFASDKRAGSIMAGIALLSGWRMRVHRSSQNLQRELEQYSWRKNRQTGEWMGEPEDANNHAMDAVRYWALSELRGAVSGAGVYTAGSQEAETCLTRY